MNANELADCLEEILKGTAIGKDCTAMLLQQAKEIEQLKADVAGWMDTAIGKTPDEGYWLNLFAKKAREK